MTIEPTTAPFSTLALAPAVLTNLTQLDHIDMIPIQITSLPIALTGHDLTTQVKAGSGKTAASALALLVRLDARSFDVRAMVPYPTRELADQVAQGVRRLAYAGKNAKVLTPCGGTPVRPQAASLEHDAHIIVDTPGRIMDHPGRGNPGLGILRTPILDEADRMLDMDFFDDVATVVHQCSTGRQVLLFPTAYPEGITKLSQRILRNPKEVKFEKHHDDSEVRQYLYEMTDSQWLHAVGQLLRRYRPASALMSCNTRR